MIRKNISFDDAHLLKLQPFLDRHGGNLSAAVREAVELADLSLEKYGTPEKASDFLKVREIDSGEMETLVESGEGIMVSPQVLSWLVKNTSGRLLDEDVVHELINPYRISTMSELEEYLNNRSLKMGWNLEVSASRGKELDPELSAMSFEGGSRDIRELVAETVSLFLARWMNLEVEVVHRKSNSTTIYLKPFVRHEPGEIPPGVLKYFGSMDRMYREIERKPDFWKTLVELYKFFNYQRVNIDRNLFEAFAAGEYPNINKYFEMKAGRLIHEIPLSELILLFKQMVMVSQLMNDIEINTEKGKEYIKIYHDYSSEEVTAKMVSLSSDVFREGSHSFSVISLKGLIILEFHDPEIEKDSSGLPQLSAE